LLNVFRQRNAAFATTAQDISWHPTSTERAHW
jgi:hypothetical protein